MTAASGINQCIFCNKKLYGIVAYCPYCGKQPDKNYAPPEKTESFSVKDISSPAYKKPEATIQSDAPSSGQKRSDAPAGHEHSASKPSGIINNEYHDQLQSEIAAPNPKKNSGIWKWIVFFILLAGISAFFVPYKLKHFFNSGGHADSAGNKMVSEKNDAGTGITGREESSNEAARDALLDALREGVSLSVSVSSLPKLEKVLEAARKLQAISPRYQQQVDSAEKNLRDASERGDRIVMTYINRLIEARRYNEKQISYAFNTIQNSALAPREKIVAELLIRHIKIMGSAGSPGPAVLLNDFYDSFKNYID